MVCCSAKEVGDLNMDEMSSYEKLVAQLGEKWVGVALRKGRMSFGTTVVNRFFLQLKRPGS